jgi:acetyltransferase-like isoleucine patch superfamily enzyme
LYTVVRSLSEISHILLRSLRLIYYNLTCFMFFRSLPWSTVVYGKIRLLHRPCRLSIGRNCRIGDGTYFATSRTATIETGDDVTINLGCVFVSMERISIGSHVAIGEYVSIRDQAHNFAPGHGVRDQGYKVAPVEIGSNVWIGRGAFIGPGTRIGDNCIVGANSVVHGEFPPGVLIAGAPAVAKIELARSPGDDGGE